MSREQSNGARALTIAALGVVYGDIGTSPLYALKESVQALGEGPAEAADVLGILSLFIWTLILSVTIKYVVLILRADNDGEGGILALMSLVRPTGPAAERRWGVAILAMGMFGAALLYGDGVITPAISVLSAVEGLQVAWPSSAKLVIPLTMFILIALFSAQSRGTASVGRVFGPVMLLWFSALGLMGIAAIAQHPQVLVALSPTFALGFLAKHGLHAGHVLGGVFLCATGGEALYADMGHFGLPPIRRAWFTVVLPGLALNYFGQGAWIIAHGGLEDGHPFYALAPSLMLVPLVVLATAATVIASQALISGAFSLTSQAIQMGLLPRMDVIHTSAEESGQIYVPFVNMALLIGCLVLVGTFKSASALAAAYGIAVTLTMIITTLLFAGWLIQKRGWRPERALLICVPLGLIELGFFTANLLKFLDGGWFPIALGLAIFTIMSTWRMGRRLMASRIYDRSIDLDVLQRIMREDEVVRPKGIAVFMTSDNSRAPDAMYRNYAHNHVLHATNLLVTVIIEQGPYVAEARRVEASSCGDGFWHINLRYGFMDIPDVPRALATLPALGVPWDESVTYFLGRDNAVRGDYSSTAGWRVALFAFLARNAQQAASYFKIPPSAVIEIGAQVDL